MKTWPREMEEYGSDFIAKSPEWHDHELGLEWAGFRSSPFSSAVRIIYKILKEEVVVRVVRVTTNHDYKLR